MTGSQPLSDQNSIFAKERTSLKSNAHTKQPKNTAQTLIFRIYSENVLSIDFTILKTFYFVNAL